MSPLSLDEIVRQVQDLPSPPAVVMELLASVDTDEVDLSVLARKVSHDQALSAKMLRMANSSRFGLQVKVTTVQQAITFLGFQSTRELITAAALTGCFAAGACDGFDDQAFWRHSLATAVCACVLARHLRINQGYAFTAGLLHDIGRLVLVSTAPQRYADVIAWRRANDGELLEAERAVLGVDHVAAGVALAQHWNFSDTIRLAIAHHHDPATPGAGLLASIIHVANAIVHALDLAREQEELVPPVSSLAWRALGLSEADYLQVFRETEVQFDEAASVLIG